MQFDQFTTPRLYVQNWQHIIADSVAHHRLEADLRGILTKDVLQHLPPSLNLDHCKGDLSLWIAARDAESEVLLVSWKDTAELVGLVFLAREPNPIGQPTFHIGYLIAQTAWGRGIATELLTGLVTAFQTAGPARLIGGVALDNAASARVLQKAGFKRDPDQSTDESDIYVHSVH